MFYYHMTVKSHFRPKVDLPGYCTELFNSNNTAKNPLNRNFTLDKMYSMETNFTDGLSEVVL